MINVSDLCVDFGGRPLFDNVSFFVNSRDRIALTGKNGAGKSTLLKIIAGLQQPTSGTVSYPKDLTIGYLPQHMICEDKTTVRQEASKAFDDVERMNSRLEAMQQELAERSDYDSEGYAALIDRISALSDTLSMSSAGNIDAAVEKTLLGLGFERRDFERQTGEFSGGWRMRIELAKILLRRPSVFLLDEPTNHLDIESIQWLETFLAAYPGAVILVSHDRAFLDNVTNRTIEISLGKIYDYRANYSKYVELRKERREQQLRAYYNQQKEIKDTEDFIERFRYKATKAVQVQSRIKQLAKIERIEVDEEDMSRLNLRFPPAPRSGDYPVIMENAGKAYGIHQVFDNADMIIPRGGKVAFVGKNGEGKTTMVRCIMGETDFTGKIKIGHNVKIGYFAQNQASLLDGELTVFDTIDRVATGEIRTKIRDILGAFMFGGDASDKKVKVLSGGERSRLAMIRLLLEPVNLLILDEPTNHLDMQSKDVLKQAIKDFDGTAIIVSHDREFLDGLVDTVYEFTQGKVVQHIGGVYDFLQHKKIESLRDIEKKAEESKSRKSQEQKQAPSKQRREQDKEYKKLVRRAENNVKLCEAAIAETEVEIKELEGKMAESPADTEVFKAYADAKKRLECQMSDWEQALSELEKFSG